jgi:hypothetical protein
MASKNTQYFDSAADLAAFLTANSTYTVIQIVQEMRGGGWQLFYAIP